MKPRRVKGRTIQFDSIFDMELMDGKLVQDILPTMIKRLEDVLNDPTISEDSVIYECNWGSYSYYIQTFRDETPAEINRRLKRAETTKKQKKKMDEQKKERERKEYERLKKKFES